MKKNAILIGILTITAAFVSNAFAQPVSILGDDIQRFELKMNEKVTLLYDGVQREGGIIRIIYNNDVLCWGENWEVNRFDTHIFYMRLNSWQGFKLEVDTANNVVYAVYDAVIKKQKLNMLVQFNPMTKDLRLSFEATLVYAIKNPSSCGNPQLLTEGIVLSYCQDWQVVSPLKKIYDLRNDKWKDIYWLVDLNNRQAYRIKNGKFGVSVVSLNEIRSPLGCQLDIVTGSKFQIIK